MITDIFVPPEQVIDTVDLYFIKNRQRRLSLRFLSWFVLHDNIQIDVHDSIEDAYSALKLYKAYQEMEEKGVFDQKLDELYKEGRQYVSAAFTYCGDVVMNAFERIGSPLQSPRKQWRTIPNPPVRRYSISGSRCCRVLMSTRQRIHPVHSAPIQLILRRVLFAKTLCCAAVSMCTNSSPSLESL